MFNFLLMGCGRISKKHSELLGKNKINNAKLVGVCDIDEEKAKNLGTEYGVPYFNDIERAIKNIECDVVVILTPSGMHAEHILQVAKFKKHIVVEKPMTLNVLDSDKVIEECNKQNIKLFVVKQNRFNKPIQQLKKTVQENKFGKIFLATIRVRWARHQEYYDQDSWRGTWKYDGGVLSNQASHHLDLLEWIMGDIKSVYAKSITALANIETEDTAVVVLKFTNGALGIIEATTATRPKNIEGSISILGEKGTVVIGGIAVDKVETWKFVDQIEEENQIRKDYSREVSHVYGIGHKKYYDHVIDALMNKSNYMIDGNEGRKSIKLINAIYESVRNNKEIIFDNK